MERKPTISNHLIFSQKKCSRLNQGLSIKGCNADNDNNASSLKLSADIGNNINTYPNKQRRKPFSDRFRFHPYLIHDQWDFEKISPASHRNKKKQSQISACQ